MTSRDQSVRIPHELNKENVHFVRGRSDGKQGTKKKSGPVIKRRPFNNLNGNQETQKLSFDPKLKDGGILLSRKDKSENNELKENAQINAFRSARINTTRRKQRMAPMKKYGKGLFSSGPFRVKTPDKKSKFNEINQIQLPETTSLHGFETKGRNRHSPIFRRRLGLFASGADRNRTQDRARGVSWKQNSKDKSKYLKPATLYLTNRIERQNEEIPPKHNDTEELLHDRVSKTCKSDESNINCDVCDRRGHRKIEFENEMNIWNSFNQLNFADIPSEVEDFANESNDSISLEMRTPRHPVGSGDFDQPGMARTSCGDPVALILLNNNTENLELLLKQDKTQTHDNMLPMPFRCNSLTSAFSILESSSLVRNSSNYVEDTMDEDKDPSLFRPIPISLKKDTV